MLVNDKLFYSEYLKEYHTVKVHYLNLLLEQDELLKERLAKEEFVHSLRGNTKFIIQADIRQNMFHAIETFFELFLPFYRIKVTFRTTIRSLKASQRQTGVKIIKLLSTYPAERSPSISLMMKWSF